MSFIIEYRVCEECLNIFVGLMGSCYITSAFKFFHSGYYDMKMFLQGKVSSKSSDGS